MLNLLRISKLKISLYALSISFFFSTLIIYGSIVIDSNNLPKGWEIPKVRFVHMWAFAMMMLSLLQIFSTLKLNKKIYNYRKIIFNFFKFALVILLISIGSILSTYEQIATYGNEFREQGLIFYILIITSFTLLYINSSRIYSKDKLLIIVSIFVSYVLSSIIHSIEGISQVVRILSLYDDRSLEVILNGTNIYGYFGQSNFYVGHILIGYTLLLFTLVNIKNIFFLLEEYLSIGKYQKKLIIILHISATFIVFFGIVTAAKLFGIILLLISTILIILSKIRFNMFEYNYIKFLAYIFIASLILYLPILGLFSHYMQSKASRYDISHTIINEYVNRPLNNIENMNLLVFGSGFDTLGEHLKENKLFINSYIDRAHNMLLDIIVSSGIIGVLFFLILIYFVYTRINKTYNKSINNNQILLKRIIQVSSIILLLLLLRSHIHTHSAINILNIFIFIYVNLLLSSKSITKNNILMYND